MDVGEEQILQPVVAVKAGPVLAKLDHPFP
jgi:hypothetical protein